LKSKQKQLEDIILEFDKTNLWEVEFLKDSEFGLEKSNFLKANA